MDPNQYPPPGYGAQQGQQHPQQQQAQQQQPAQQQQNGHYPPLAPGQPQQQPQQPGQQQQQHTPPGHDQHTLPPLQQMPHGYGHLPPLYTGTPHTASPHPPQTPGANSAGSHTHSPYPNMPAPPNTGAMAPPPTSYMGAPPGYATSHPTSHAPPPIGRLQDIRPMPPNGGYTSPMTPFPPFHQQAPLPGQHPHPQYIPTQEMEPTHVVGSQGRRGVLPSVHGRPVPGAGNGTTKSMIPQKDADGKFPCPHCHKTYLHAKHLKRHLLRHTGDRPYTCHLCKDTFSRSDILKRHFQKCSIRRGNPTGANHLAGQRRNTTSSVHRMSVGNEDINAIPNGAASYPGTVNGSPTVNGDGQSYASSIASMSARSSRANSLIQPQNGYHDGRHLAGLGMPLPSPGHGPDGHPATSGPYSAPLPQYAMRPHSASNPVHPSTYGYGAPHNGAPVFPNMKTDDHGVNNYTAAATPVHNGTWNGMYVPGQAGYMQAGQQQGQQDQHSAAPRTTEQSIDGQTFTSQEEYEENYLNGMHPHPHNASQGSYNGEGVRPYAMAASR